MENARVLIQLDTDVSASLSDRIIALDSDADHVFTYSGVRAEQIPNIVRGAIFSRDSSNLMRTAIYIAGSDLAIDHGNVDLISGDLIFGDLIFGGVGHALVGESREGNHAEDQQYEYAEAHGLAHLRGGLEHLVSAGDDLGIHFIGALRGDQ